MRILALTFVTPILLLAAISPANAPTTRPSTHTLTPQGIRYDVPSALHVTFTEADEVPYLSDDDVSCMVIKVLPRGTPTDINAVEAKIRSLLEEHRKNDDEVIETPLIEIDPRFLVRIHERYALKDGRKLDTIYLYRQVAGFLLRLEMTSFTSDADRIAADHKVAEQVLLSARR